MSTRPVALQVQPASIPQVLRSMPSWVAWSYEQRGDKWTKPPRRADGNGYAKANDPTTWASFDAALLASGGDGIGLVLTQDLVGVDLDHVLNQATGELEPWAAEVLRQFDGCYVERSPGGDGLRIFCKGVALRSGKGGPENRCEVYDKLSPRYLTVTGQRWGQGEVREAQAALDWLHSTHMAKSREVPQKPQPSQAGSVDLYGADDEHVLGRARSASNSVKFERLWAGNDGGDASSGDAALLAMLSFWTQDAAQLDRLFRMSGRMRPKWDELRGAQTYGDLTIGKVLAMPGARFGEGQPADQSSFDKAAAIKKARELLAPRLAERDAPHYPVEALGPLADACREVAAHGQVDAALAGQCLLGAASLLTQGLFNVQTLTSIGPLSLNLLSLGNSGCGKSTAQSVALQPVFDAQREQAAIHRAELADWKDRPKGKERGEPPPQPAYRLCADSTVEGLRRDLDDGCVSQGMFSDEAAAILAGYGMSPDMRSKTASTLSRLWDKGHLSVSRATAGRTERYGVRLAAHWLLQPMAAAETMSDPMLSALGFWPRFLVAWPAPQPPRLHRPFHPAALPAVVAYWSRCNELLAQALPDDATDMQPLLLTAEARSLMGTAFERFEVQARKGSMQVIEPFALRAIEQACRVAGVLAAFAGDIEVSETTARNALALVNYSLDTWQAIIEGGAADPTAAHALKLYEWLAGRPGAAEKLATIVKDGPNTTRTKDKRDAALELLQAHGLVQHLEGGRVMALEIAP